MGKEDGERAGGGLLVDVPTREMSYILPSQPTILVVLYDIVNSGQMCCVALMCLSWLCPKALQSPAVISLAPPRQH